MAGLAQLVEHWSTEQEVLVSFPQTRAILMHGLKITVEKALPVLDLPIMWLV